MPKNTESGTTTSVQRGHHWPPKKDRSDLHSPKSCRSYGKSTRHPPLESIHHRRFRESMHPPLLENTHSPRLLTEQSEPMS